MLRMINRRAFVHHVLIVYVKKKFVFQLFVYSLFDTFNVHRYELLVLPNEQHPSLTLESHSFLNDTLH